MRKAVFAIILLTLAVFVMVEDLHAGLQWKSSKFHGLGIKADYTYSKDFHNTGCYVSYRGGVASILSVFFCADIGYRLLSESINTKFGGAVTYLYFTGLEAGIVMDYNLEEIKKNHFDRKKIITTAPGIYAGLTFILPDKKWGLFLSAGGNFYVYNHDIEFYFSVTAVVNLKGL